MTLLTARENQVLTLIAEGSSTKEIGHRLGISPKTADCHRSRLMQKLDLHCTADLVRFALRDQLVGPAAPPPAIEHWLLKRVRELEADILRELAGQTTSEALLTDPAALTSAEREAGGAASETEGS